MNEELQKILEELGRAFPPKAPKGLVKKLIDELEVAGVETLRTANFPNSKYFAADRNGRVLVILAHESTKIEWWGVRKEIIDRIQAKPIDWGIALLDGDHRRGFWIHKDSFFKLKDRGIVTLGKVDIKYHFNAKPWLEKEVDLAKYFVHIRKFLEYTGLGGDLTRRDRLSRWG